MQDICNVDQILDRIHTELGCSSQNGNALATHSYAHAWCDKSVVANPSHRTPFPFIFNHLCNEWQFN
jgi:hypothetical protein